MPSFLSGPVGAAYHVVTALSAGLVPLLGALAPAAAIVAFTVAVRLILLPFSYRAMRGQAAQARLAPRIQALHKRYAGQPGKLRGEIAALREEEGTGPFTGCLPAVLQWPFLSVLYLVFRSPVIGGMHNALLAHTLLGAGLGASVLGGGLLGPHGAVFLGLFALLAAVGWLSGRLAGRLAAPGGQAEPGNPGRQRDPDRAGQRGEAAQPGGTPAWLTRLMPFTTLAIAPFLPLAADLYLLTTTGWTLLERVCLRRALLRRASSRRASSRRASSRRASSRRAQPPAPPARTGAGRAGA